MFLWVSLLVYSDSEVSFTSGLLTRVSISSSKKQIFIVIAAQEALTKCQAWFICNFTGLRYYLKQTCKMGFIQVLKMMFKKLKSTPIRTVRKTTRMTTKADFNSIFLNTCNIICFLQKTLLLIVKT